MMKNERDCGRIIDNQVLSVGYDDVKIKPLLRQFANNNL